MSRSLKKLLCLAALMPCIALAQNFPSKSVTIIVSSAPGGPTDVLIRPLATELRDHFKQPFVVENRGGAGGSIATAQVARAAGDGYTLLATVDAPIVVNPAIYKSLSYDSLKDLRPVAMLGDGGDIALAVLNDSPVKTVKELVESIRKDPKASYVSSGVGFPSHIVSELFKKAGNFDATHIPAKGAGNALIQFLTGGSHFYFMPASMAAAQIPGGKIRVLAVAARKRNHLLPDVPTLAESGYPAVSPAPYWITIFAPAGTPKPVIEALSTEIRRVTATPAYREILGKQGLVPSNLGPDELTERVREDFNYWKNTITPLGITVN